MAGSLLLALLLTGCATPPQTRQLLLTPEDSLPARIELAQTPFFPQQRYQCGPAALATVLTAHGIGVTPDELVGRVYIPALQGSLREEIAAAARDYGMLAYPLRPSLADLLEDAHRRQHLGLVPDVLDEDAVKVVIDEPRLSVPLVQPKGDADDQQGADRQPRSPPSPSCRPHVGSPRVRE